MIMTGRQKGWAIFRGVKLDEESKGDGGLAEQNLGLEREAGGWDWGDDDGDDALCVL